MTQRSWKLTTSQGDMSHRHIHGQANHNITIQSFIVIRYFIAKVIVEIPVVIIECVIFSALLYWTTGLNPGPDRFVYFIFMLMAYDLSCHFNMHILIHLQSRFIFHQLLSVDVKYFTYRANCCCCCSCFIS